jgi:outer membrane murein-binding lipoprotein Lpp
MNHDDAATRLADLEKGRLRPGEAEEVQAHRRDCPECRELSATYRLMAEASATRDPADGPGHLSTAEIAARALHPHGSLGDAQDPAARHLAACRECAGDLRDAREANRVAGLKRPVTRTGSGRVFAIAAAVLCALAGLAAFVGWQRAGSLSSRVRTLEGDLAGLNARVIELNRTIAAADAAAEAARGAGVVSYLFLRPPGRGAAPVERLQLRPGQTEVYLALALDRPPRLPAGAAQVTVVGPGGATLVSTEVPALELRSLFERGDSMLLRVPADLLRPGPHSVRVAFLRPDGTPGSPLSLPFEVVSAPAP